MRAAGLLLGLCVLLGFAGNALAAPPTLAPAATTSTSQLTVTLTSPASGSVLSGTTILHASTTDSAGVHVADVQFNLDGVPIPGADSPVGASSWDTTQATNGAHVLTATATDQLGNTATSAPVTVTVANNAPPVPPTVSMTAPANGATVSGSVPLSAGADDTSGTVTSVQFLLDGNALGAAVTAAPYAMSWDSTTVPNGSHTLAAKATNNAGQSTTSAPLTVTVSNNVAPPPPTVAITAPVDGATLKGVVSVAATAADAAGTVTSVRFMLDGAPLSTALTVSPYTFSWDTAGVANGSHVLTAVAVNDANETTTSAPVTVTVNNVILPPPPTVVITSPIDGGTVHGTVTLSAAAGDSSGTVTQVQFFLNGSALGAPITKAPYRLVWHTRKYPDGSDVLTAIATNDSGETTTSAAVTVRVMNKKSRVPRHRLQPQIGRSAPDESDQRRDR